MKPARERPLSQTLSQTSQESRRGKFQGRFLVLHESFDRRSTLMWTEIYSALWNCWFYCDSGHFLLRRKRFVEWCLASNEWSDLPFHSFRRKSTGFKELPWTVSEWLKIGTRDKQDKPLRLSWDACDQVCNNGRSRVGFILNSDRSIWIWGQARVAVANNLSKQCQNGFKIGTRDKFAIKLR